MLSPAAQKLSDLLESRGLVTRRERCLLAVSGGSDSTALVRLFAELRLWWGFELYAAHVDHNIRANSVYDRTFTEALCQSLDIPCYVKSVPVKKIAEQHGLSLEEAGRKVRYSFFAELWERLGPFSLFTAHTADDQAETVLMRLMNGTGPAGLAAIRPLGYYKPSKFSSYSQSVGRQCANQPAESQAAHRPSPFEATPSAHNIEQAHYKIVRPLLSFSKEELRLYLGSLGQDWCEDETNHVADAPRTYVRLKLIPQLQKWNTQVVEALGRLASSAQEDEDYFTHQIDLLWQQGAHLLGDVPENGPVLAHAAGRTLRETTDPLKAKPARNSLNPKAYRNLITLPKSRIGYGFKRAFLASLPTSLRKRLWRRACQEVLSLTPSPEQGSNIVQALSIGPKEGTTSASNIAPPSSPLIEVEQKDGPTSTLEDLNNGLQALECVHYQSLENFLTLPNGKCLLLPSQLQLAWHNDLAELTRQSSCPLPVVPPAHTIPLPTLPQLNLDVPPLVLDFPGWHLRLILRMEAKSQYPQDYKIWLSSKRFVECWQKNQAFTMRPRLPGDKIFPAGGCGRQKLKKIMQGEAIPQEERDLIPLLCCGQEVIWAIGFKANQIFLAQAGEVEVVSLQVLTLPQEE